jgi:hypothetical protein
MIVPVARRTSHKPHAHLEDVSPLVAVSISCRDVAFQPTRLQSSARLKDIGPEIFHFLSADDCRPAQICSPVTQTGSSLLPLLWFLTSAPQGQINHRAIFHASAKSPSDLLGHSLLLASSFIVHTPIGANPQLNELSLTPASNSLRFPLTPMS